MSKIGKLCIVLFLVTSLIGCSSDDDGGNDTSADLIGTWSITSFNYNGDSSIDLLGETITTFFTGVGQNFDYEVTLTENPNEFTASGSYDIILNFTIDGITQSENISINNVQSAGTWERNGNILSVDGNFIEIDTTIPTIGGMTMGDVTILELTDTTLRLSQEVSQDITQNGITSSVNLMIETVLTRQ